MKNFYLVRDIKNYKNYKYYQMQYYCKGNLQDIKKEFEKMQEHNLTLVCYLKNGKVKYFQLSPINNKVREVL